MGRKKLGNVLFARRVSPESAAIIEDILRQTRLGVTSITLSSAKDSFEQARPAPPGPGGDISALLEDVDRLTKERDSWKTRHANAVEATQDQLASYWKREYLRLRAAWEKEHGEWAQ